MADTTLTVDIDTKEAVAALDNLKVAIAGVFTGAAIKGLMDFSDGITNITNKIKSLSPDLDTAAKNFDAIVGIAMSARAPLGDVANLFTKLQVTTRDLGISTRDVAQITETLTKALAISGTSTVEASSAMYQFNQALALGVFQGNDLHSMIQTMPQVMQGFADSIGMPLGALRDLGASGSITADMVIKYMKSIREKTDEEFAKLSPTFSQAFNTLKTSASVAFNEFEKNTQTGQNLATAIEYIAFSMYKLTKSVDDVIGPLKILVEIGAALLAWTVVGIIFVLVGEAIAGVGAAATATATAARGLVTTFEATWQLFTKLVQGALPSLAVFFERLAVRAGYFKDQIIALLGPLTQAGAAVLAFTGLDKLFSKFNSENIKDTKKELEDFRKEMKANSEQVDDTAGKNAAMEFQQKKVAYAISLAALAARQQTEDLRTNLARVEEKLKFDAEEIYLAGQFTNKSKEQIEVETALRDLGYERTDAIRKLTEEQQKLQQELKNPTVLADAVQAQELRGRIGVIGQQIEAEKKLYDQQAKSLPGYIMQLQTARILEEFRKKDTDAVIAQIEHQIALNDKLGESLRAANKSRFQAQDAIPASQLVGLTSIQKQIVEIQESARKTAMTAKEAFAAAFGETDTAEMGEQLVKGIDQIDAAYKRVAEAQIEVLKNNHAIAVSFDTGVKDAWAGFVESATNNAAIVKNSFNTFTNGLEDAFVKLATTGKLSFSDLANSIIADLARIAVRKAIVGIGTFFGLPGLASGGPVLPNQPYIVGEKGPELFLPTGAGQIVPNNKLNTGASGGGTGQANVTYNIQAVDAQSFRSLVARDPSFIYAVTEQGRRSQPTRSR